jgi:hypothetical protein
LMACMSWALNSRSSGLGNAQTGEHVGAAGADKFALNELGFHA